MSKLAPKAVLASCCVALFVASLARQDPPQQLKCEDIYTNIEVFKGMPAEDLIPAMEFMAASMKWECKDCHDVTDYTKETHAIETTRQMVLLQRDINEKWFNGRLEVTCMTCHNGQDHPDNMPMPGETTVRHGRVSNPPKSADLFSKHVAAAGPAPVQLTRTGTMSAPNELTHEIETKPVELTVAGSKFRLVSGDLTVVSDGAQVTYGGVLLWGEPVAHFQRIARGWWGDGAFAGLDGMVVSGRDRVGSLDVFVVRANRAATKSQEELYFDNATGLLTKFANMRRSSVGTTVSAIDYADFKQIDGTSVPMRVTVTFAGGQQWVMVFSESNVSATVDANLFRID